MTAFLRIFGGSGNDYIDAEGTAGAAIFGGTGMDTIIGGLGDDVIQGGPGNDTITGGGGADQLYGDSTSADPNNATYNYSLESNDDEFNWSLANGSPAFIDGGSHGADTLNLHLSDAADAAMSARTSA